MKWGYGRALALRVESRRGGESGKRKCKQKRLRILEFYRKARPRCELLAAGERCEHDRHVPLASERFCSHEALVEVCPLPWRLSSSALAQNPKAPTGFWTLYDRCSCFSLKLLRSDLRVVHGLQRVFWVVPVLVMLTTEKGRMGPSTAFMRLCFPLRQRSLWAVHCLFSSRPCSCLSSIFLLAADASWALCGASGGLTTWNEDETILSDCEGWLEVPKEGRTGCKTRKTSFYFEEDF